MSEKISLDSSVFLYINSSVFVVLYKYLITSFSNPIKYSHTLLIKMNNKKIEIKGINYQRKQF